MTKSKWKITQNGFGRTRHLLSGDDFEISVIDSSDTGLFSGDGTWETAIVHDGKYYILNGDHRKEFTKLVPKGLTDCLNYFSAHQELKSSWSNSLEN